MHTQSDPTLIIGAGIAGLVAAIDLHRAGRPVLVLEAAHEVGGRVRTTVQGGFRLDHGFQVLFTAYPVLNAYLDHQALALREFLPAAQIVRASGARALVGDALRLPSLMLPSLTGGALSVADLWRMLQLRRLATSLTVDECFAEEYSNRSTHDLLVQRGFSSSAIDGFFAPFYGGILLDRSLSTRASVLLFTFKMLAEGSTAVPSDGMGAIPRQLASQLPAHSVRCNTRVSSLLAEDGNAVGVTLEDGSEMRAANVVVATDLITAHALAATANVSLDEPRSVLGCTTIYYRSGTPLLPGRALWLNAAADATVSHAIAITEVAPSYAPPGMHLIAATVLGQTATAADEALDAAVRADLAHMAPDGDAAALERVAVWRVPLAQFAQTVRGMLPQGSAVTSMRGLFRASEVLHSSSLDGAARGGQMAARAVLQGD